LELIIIAAMTANRVIGCNNTIPWHIPEEMAHFKATTMGHWLIMGRKTYESIGRPLPGRRTIVVSSNPSFRPHADCTVVASLDQAISYCLNAEKVFIIGGEQLYRAALPLATTLILTVIDQEYAGDAWFPDFSDLPFALVARRELSSSPLLTVLIYQRVQPAPASYQTLPA
jgi:dihydrofolate reductase